MRNLSIVSAGLAGILASCSATPASVPETVVDRSDITVIAHRGASGYLPEHTLDAYQLAIDMGADFIEPDLVMTSDGVLVARHDPWLSDSTNVADHPEFADRRTTVTGPDGTALTDWFVWDFTYEELSTLRARQVRAGRDHSHDDRLTIPRFEEILNLVGVANHLAEPEELEDFIGVYPELKWPSHHAERGLDMASEITLALTGPLVTRLAWEDVNRFGPIAGLPVIYTEDEYKADPCYYHRCQYRIRIQSFEDAVLRDLNELTDFPLVQLVYPEGYALDGAPSYELEDIAEYADGVGPFKTLVLDYRTQEPTGYAQRARELGLEVHAWTFRDDDIAPGFETIEDEIRAILDAGATGFFTDFPDTGRAVADEWASD